MAIAIALFGFNDLGRPVTPTFLFRNRFYLQLVVIKDYECVRRRNFNTDTLND